jgi:catechol 2,3-dioxygenase
MTVRLGGKVLWLGNRAKNGRAPGTAVDSPGGELIMINTDRIGHVVLKVRDLARSRRFYHEVMGLDVMSEMPGMAFLASHRRDHHEIGLMEVGDGAEGPKGPQVGLAHVAFRLSDEAELVKAYRELKEREVPISFTVHHGITKSVYFLDPDGNQLEVYCDVAPQDRPKLVNDYMGMERLDFARSDPGLADVIKSMGIRPSRPT